jgi:nucleoside-diphosphate-sugar epimerase
MKCLVTGGGGFVGSALCRALKTKGYEVLALGRRQYPALQALGIETIQHDLSTDPERLVSLAKGIDVVFHTAAHVKMWGRYDEFVQGNVTATRYVIDACRRAGVERLVYTSSPSVIADGTNLRGINEKYPYPLHHDAYYPMTKAIAEREVLQANSSKLSTISLRPHLIFGPGDTNFVPTILQRAASGRLVQVGGGLNQVDLTYIDDCVAAHLLAAEALLNRASSRGRAYFISQGTPVSLWEWIGKVLEYHHLPPVGRKVSTTVANTAAFGVELVWRLLGIRSEPPLTRFLASEMATDHYFDITAAREELRFSPSCSVWEATERSFRRS